MAAEGGSGRAIVHTARPLIERASRAWTAQLILLALLAGLLRLPTLGKFSLWRDELTVAVAGLEGFGSAIETAKTHASATPLDYVLVSASHRLLGSGEVAARLPAATFGIAAVVAIYFLGRATGNHWVGVVAALLLATSPSHVWYSQEARFYSELVFFVIVSTLAFLAAVKHMHGWLWLLYAATVALGLYAGYQMALMIVIHLGALVVGGALRWWPLPRAGWAWMGLALGTAALLFLPWYLWDDAARVFTYPSPPFDKVAVNLAWILSFNPPAILSNSPVEPTWAITGLLAGTALAAAVVAVGRRQPFPLVSAGAIVVLPIVVLLILRHQSYFFSGRHLMFLLPVVYLVIAYATVHLMERQIALMACGGLLLATFVVMAGLGLEHQWGMDHKGEEWREAVRYLESHMSDDDRLATLSDAQIGQIRYYHDFDEVSLVLSPDDLDRFLKETPGDAWVLAVIWGKSAWQDLAPALRGDRFEVVRFPAIRIFVHRGDSTTRPVAAGDDLLEGGSRHHDLLTGGTGDDGLYGGVARDSCTAMPGRTC